MDAKLHGQLMGILERHARALIALIALVALGAVALSARDARRYGGTDLRPKVLAARAVLQGLDPYLPQTFEWTARTPPRLTDPETVYYPNLSRVTYPPSLLMFYVPLAPLPYRLQRGFWWLAEWAALGAMIAVLARSIADRRVRLAFVGVAVACFVASFFWRLHVERGQYYVFVALLFSLDLVALRRPSGRPAWLGIPIGVATAFRPTAGLALVLLWLMGERRAALRGAATAALLVAASLLVFDLEHWRHYFQNATALGEFVATELRRHWAVDPEAPPGLVTLIEGYQLTPLYKLAHRSANLTVCGVTMAPWCLPLSSAVALGIAVSTAGAMAWLRWRRAPRATQLLLLLVAPLLLDYTVPMRWNYADVMFLPVVALMLPLALERSARLSTSLLLLAALLTCLYVLEHKYVVVLRQALFLASAGALGVSLLLARSPRPVVASPRYSAAQEPPD